MFDKNDDKEDLDESKLIIDTINSNQPDKGIQENSALPDEHLTQAIIAEDNPATKESAPLLVSSQPVSIKHSNYTSAIISSFVVSTVASIVIAFLFHHSLDGSDSGDIGEIVIENGVLISKTVSASGYFFRLIDILTREITLLDRIRSACSKSPLPEVEQDKAQDKYGVTAGFIVAVAASAITLSTQNFFNGEISHIILKACTTIIEIMSSYLGLGNRIGQAAKNLYLFQSQNRTRGINYSLAIAFGGIIIGGLFLGIAIGLHLLTGGIAMQILSGISLVGSSASASGYIGRLFDFSLGDQSLYHCFKNRNKTDCIKKPNTSWEKSLTWAGVAVGVVLGVAIAVAALHFGIGIPILFFLAGALSHAPAAVMVVSAMTTLVSAFGGLGNRLGQFLDKNKAQSDKAKEKPKNEEKLAESGSLRENNKSHIFFDPSVAQKKPPIQADHYTINNIASS